MQNAIGVIVELHQEAAFFEYGLQTLKDEKDKIEMSIYCYATEKNKWKEIQELHAKRQQIEGQQKAFCYRLMAVLLARRLIERNNSDYPETVDQALFEHDKPNAFATVRREVSTIQQEARAAIKLKREIILKNTRSRLRSLLPKNIDDE